MLFQAYIDDLSYEIISLEDAMELAKSAPLFLYEAGSLGKLNRDTCSYLNKVALRFAEIQKTKGFANAATNIAACCVDAVDDSVARGMYQTALKALRTSAKDPAEIRLFHALDRMMDKRCPAVFEDIVVAVGGVGARFKFITYVLSELKKL